ncbi:metacaspase-1-like isoform X1 [Cervus elaphus]|uniref:metacaspase-1-like isoform X1 n=1 Tax=Cervus elaphus TaxID=9860 RepID=UPI001CC2CFDA|nr:metacaspase-1-like isoform X1 [Cervus elaphus]
MLEKERVGTARLGHPAAGRRLPAGGAGASGGLGAPGSFRALPPAGLPAGSGGGSGAARGEAAVGPNWAPGASRGRRGPRNPAAGDWSPPLRRQRLECHSFHSSHGSCSREPQLKMHEDSANSGKPEDTSLDVK